MDLRSRGGLGAGRTCCGIELAVAAAPAPSAEGGSFWRGKEREGVSLCQDVRPAASGAGGKGPTFGCAGGVGGAQARGRGWRRVQRACSGGPHRSVAYVQDPSASGRRSGCARGRVAYGTGRRCPSGRCPRCGVQLNWLICAFTYLAAQHCRDRHT